MNILSLQHILVYGGLLSLVMGVLIFGSLIYNPRLWLQDYPAEIRAKVPPLTPTEKRKQRLLMIPFLLIMIGVPFYATHLLRVENGGTISFLAAYLNTCLILNVFNLFDAAIVDFLVLALFQPKFATLPGAEGMEYLYRDWPMHWKNFFKGIIIAGVLALPITLAAMAL